MQKKISCEIKKCKHNDRKQQSCKLDKIHVCSCSQSIPKNKDANIEIAKEFTACASFEIANDFEIEETEE